WAWKAVRSFRWTSRFVASTAEIAPSLDHSARKLLAWAPLKNPCDSKASSNSIGPLIAKGGTSDRHGGVQSIHDSMEGGGRWRWWWSHQGATASSSTSVFR